MIVQAMSGGMSLTGEPEGRSVRAGLPIGDLCAGMYGLIGGLAAEWNPEKYTNEYRANLLKIIEAKRTKVRPALEVQEMEVDAKVVDLTPWSLAKPAGLILIMIALLLYTLFADVSVLKLPNP